MPWPCTLKNILSGIDITVCHIATARTDMGPHRERFLHDFSTLVALLAGKARIDSHDLMSSICSFGFKDVKKRAPTGITDGFGQMLIFEHATDVQVLHGNPAIAGGILFGRFEMEITALTRNL